MSFTETLGAGDTETEQDPEGSSQVQKPPVYPVSCLYEKGFKTGSPRETGTTTQLGYNVIGVKFCCL